MLLLHLAAAPSVLAVYATATACGIALVQLGDAGPSAGLIQCERTLCVAAGRWQLPDSVKPAAQRGVQNLRGFVPPEAERVQTR